MKTIFRMEKIGSTQCLINRCHHLYSISKNDIDVFNRKSKNLMKPIYTLLGTKSDAYRDIRNLKKRNNLEKRKNSTEAIEMIFSVSNEFFEDNDKEKIRIFANRTLKFLKEQFGQEQIAHVALHVHETTPHIHAMIVPWVIQTKRGKFDSEPFNMIKTSMFTRKYLSDLQAYYWSIFSDFKLNNLEKKSDKKHTTLREYYQRLINERESTESADIISNEVVYENRSNVRDNKPAALIDYSGIELPECLKAGKDNDNAEMKNKKNKKNII